MTYQAIQMDSPEDLTIAGIVINQFRQNLARNVTDPIMEAHGLTDIDDEKFYPASVMDAIYREIFDGGNGSQPFVAMGRASAKTTLDFIKPESPNDVLDNIHNVFTAYLRNMPEGFGIIVNDLGDNTFNVWNNTQVPNDLIYGFLWECIKETTPRGQQFSLIPSDDYNSDSTVGAHFTISWA
ncbi:MAG: hypothetical protein WBC91_09760 [Phototrophicaceae bacterium]